MGEWPMAGLSGEVLDSLCSLAELNESDPIFNRRFVELRVESAIERFRWFEQYVDEELPHIARLREAIELCGKLQAALIALPVEDHDFAFSDLESPQLDGNFLEELSLVRDKLQAISNICLPSQPPGRPPRTDSHDFIGHLVETFYLVDRGRKSGRGCTKHRRLRDFLAICIEEAGVQGAPAIRDVKDSAWKKYVEPAITSAIDKLSKRRKFYEDLVNALPGT